MGTCGSNVPPAQQTRVYTDAAVKMENANSETQKVLKFLFSISKNIVWHGFGRGRCADRDNGALEVLRHRTDGLNVGETI